MTTSCSCKTWLKALGLILLVVGIIGAILLLDVNTSCLPEVGGSGCE